MSQSPEKSSLLQLLRTPFEGFNRFILNDLRDGRLSLAHLPYTTTFIVISGFIILFASVSLILFTPQLRQQSTLITMVSNSSARQAVVPAAIIPISIFLLAVSWGFLLTGAIRSKFWILALIFIVYFISPLDSAISTYYVLLANSDLLPKIYLALAIISLIATPVFIIMRRNRPANSLLEFSTLFVLVLFALQLNQIVLLAPTAGEEVGTQAAIQLDAYFSLFRFLIWPFMLNIGADIAIFVRKLSFWTADIIHYRLSKKFPTVYIGLGIITLLQLINVWQNTADFFQQTVFSGAIWPFLGGLIPLVLVWGLWWLLKKLSKEEDIQLTDDDLIDERTNWLVFPAILLTLNLVLIYPIVSLLDSLLIKIGVIFSRDFSVLGLLVNFELLLIESTYILGVIAAIASLIGGIWLVVSQRFLSGYFLTLFGAIYMAGSLTVPGSLLDLFYTQLDTPADFWWTILILMFLIVWLIKGELTTQRATSLLVLSLINTLLFRQTDFIEEPLYPILEFAGTGVILFGFIWDTFTVGYWANEDSPALPRESRIYLYLGYVIFAAAILIWAVAVRDSSMVEQFTGGGALAGLKRIGRPMLYMLYPLLLTLPKDHLPLTHHAQQKEKDGRSN